MKVNVQEQEPEIEENINRIVIEGDQAHTVDEALNLLRLGVIHLWRPQEIRFLTPLFLSTCVYMDRTPSPLVDVHTWSRWNTHRSLEMASTMTYQT